jgi:hypothetical protein
MVWSFVLFLFIFLEKLVNINLIKLIKNFGMEVLTIEMCSQYIF